MGCFDFTYADNGENVMGRNGYLYLTSRFATAAKLDNPLRFSSTDEYGRFNCVSDGYEFELDIYALLAMEVYLDGVPVSDKDAPVLERHAQAAIDALAARTYDSLQAKDAEEAIRLVGIDYFYRPRYCRAHDPVTQRVARIGGQKERRVKVSATFSHPIPLLITRKRLHLAGEPAEIADEWCFASGEDPNQGFSPTTLLYYAYERPSGD